MLWFNVQDGSTNCQQGTDCPGKWDTCEDGYFWHVYNDGEDGPEGKVCGRLEEELYSDPRFICDEETQSSYNTSSYEECFEVCPGKCRTVVSEIGATKLLVTTAASGQSYRWSSSVVMLPSIHVEIVLILLLQWRQRSGSDQREPQVSGKKALSVQEWQVRQAGQCLFNPFQHKAAEEEVNYILSGGSWTWWKYPCMSKKKILSEGRLKSKPGRRTEQKHSLLPVIS